MNKIIWIDRKKYYLYDTYTNIDKAKKIANYYKKKRKAKHFILTKQKGWFNEKVYELYLTKVMKLW